MRWQKIINNLRIAGFIGFLIISASAGNLDAAVIHVPGDYVNIRTATMAASTGDTILVADGVYSGSGNRDIKIYGWSFVLMSENGPEYTIIDCGGSESSPHRAFQFSSSTVNYVTIEGFTIRNGYAPSNSGIGDTESCGGAISGKSSNHIIKNCIFEDNACYQRGGAVYYNGGSPTFIDCIFKNNTAVKDAGAVYLADQSSAEFSNCIFKENGADRGGAVFSINSTPTFEYCLFSGNSAALMGGAGISCATISTDTSSYLNCTFYGNQTEGLGGALYMDNGHLVVENSIISFCPQGAAIGCGLVIPGYPQLICCDIYGNAGGDYVGCISDQEHQQGNISSDPLFCAPGKGFFNISRLSPCHPDSSACGLIGAYTPGCYEGPFPVADNINFGSTAIGNAVTTPTPEIYWSYYDTAASMQAMYEIEIGSDLDWMVAELWASGQVNSADTSVVYEGAALDNHTYYYLRIRLSDGVNWGGWNSTEFLTHFDNVIQVPTEKATIQEGIDIAIDGDTVLVAGGVYTGDGNRDIELLGKAITVKSENGPEETIIDCQATPSDRHRGFHFHAFEDSTTIIEGFTITGGYGPSDNGVYNLHVGGGMYCYYASPTIKDCYIQYNHTTAPEDSIYGHGGGVHCQDCSAQFIDCDISYNGGDPSGGVHCDGESYPKFINCTITNNDMDGISGGNVEMDNCLVENNSGHGLECWGAILNECTFRGNLSGILSYYNRLEINNCIFEENEYYGLTVMGAETNFALAQVSNTVFRANVDLAVSGIYASYYLSSCEITKTEKTAIQSTYSNINLYNCTLAQNCSGPYGMEYPAIAIVLVNMNIGRSVLAFNGGYTLFECMSANPFVSCSDVYGNSGGDWTDCISKFQDTLNNFSADPLFCDSLTSDYGLMAGSPCLPEHSPCAALIGAYGLGCSFEFPTASNINYGPDAHDYIINDPAPDIFWSYTDTSALPQTAYHIQVGSDENWDTAEMWDSGPESSSDTGAVYGGADLVDHETYYLRVRIANERQWGDWNQIPLLAGLTNIVYVPSQFATIQAGIDYAFDWDTVLVAAGVYQGEGNRDIDFGGKSLIILSEDGPEATIIDCQAHESIPHRAFYLNNHEDTVTTIEGFTIQNGYNGIGGAVYCSEASLKIKKCLFIKNEADIGAAVAMRMGKLGIYECTFSGNISPEGTSNSVLEFTVGAELIMESSIIAYNSAASVYCFSPESISMSCCDIYGNDFGDWIACIADQESVHNNFSDDPLFCDHLNGDYKLQENSPCIMTKGECSPVIGALGVGCETPWICGDTNNDGAVNVSDAVRIINYVFLGSEPPEPPAAGDANCDTAVNVSDAVRIVNFIFIGGFKPCDLNGDGIPDC